MTKYGQLHVPGIKFSTETCNAKRKHKILTSTQVNQQVTFDEIHLWVRINVFRLQSIFCTWLSFINHLLYLSISADSNAQVLTLDFTSSPVFLAATGMLCVSPLHQKAAESPDAVFTLDLGLP